MAAFTFIHFKFENFWKLNARFRLSILCSALWKINSSWWSSSLMCRASGEQFWTLKALKLHNWLSDYKGKPKVISWLTCEGYRTGLSKRTCLGMGDIFQNIRFISSIFFFNKLGMGDKNRWFFPLKWGGGVSKIACSEDTIRSLEKSWLVTPGKINQKIEGSRSDYQLTFTHLASSTFLLFFCKTKRQSFGSFKATTTKQEKKTAK